MSILTPIPFALACGLHEAPRWPVRAATASDARPHL